MGRVPEDQSEISNHTAIYAERGFDGEIDSCIDSNEYWQSFGENTALFLRGQTTEAGFKNVSFNRTLAIAGGNASNNPGKKSLLTSDVAGNRGTKIKSPKVVGLRSRTGRSGRFRIAVSGANTGGSQTHRSNASYEVSYAQLQSKIRSIQKSGGNIVSVEPV